MLEILALYTVPPPFLPPPTIRRTVTSTRPTVARTGLRWCNNRHQIHGLGSVDLRAVLRERVGAVCRLPGCTRPKTGPCDTTLDTLRPHNWISSPFSLPETTQPSTLAQLEEQQRLRDISKTFSHPHNPSSTNSSWLQPGRLGVCKDTRSGQGRRDETGRFRGPKEGRASPQSKRGPERAREHNTVPLQETRPGAAWNKRCA